jgi:hypothetical protein
MIHPAIQFQFERTVKEFAQWRAVTADQRSFAPGWWWSPALAVHEQPDILPEPCATTLGLPSGATYATAALILLDALAGQTVLPWPDEFLRRHAATQAS